MDPVLGVVIKHWKEDFSAISALHIADIFQMEHVVAKEILINLAARSLLTIWPAELGQPSKFTEIKIPDGDDIKISTDWEMVETLMAKPSNKVLEDVFRREGKDYGEFTNRLHKGMSQIHHYFFRKEILDWYQRNWEKYEVSDDSTSGYISTIGENLTDEESFGMIRFGNLTLENLPAIAVILKDLDYLPKKEQYRWASFEIENPIIDPNDVAWRNYFSESFRGNWDVDHTNDLEDLKNALENVNSTTGGIFLRTQNKYLRIPTLDTPEDYYNSHKELSKLISASNLNGDVLKKNLISVGVTEFSHPSGKEKGKFDLLGDFIKAKGINWQIFKFIDDNRQKDVHGFSKDRDFEAYPKRFREDIRRLIEELRKLT